MIHPRAVLCLPTLSYSILHPDTLCCHSLMTTCPRRTSTAAGATPMQQLQLQQAHIQREQARIDGFWEEVGREMAQIDPEKVIPVLTSRHHFVTPPSVCLYFLDG